MSNHSTSLNKQNGIALLEGLIAILVFSLGILAIVGLQTVAVKQATDAKYRSDAALVANQLIGTMWVSDRTPAALQTSFNTGGTAYNAWLADVSAALPGVAAHAPTVDVSASGVVTVTVRWLAPSEDPNATAHSYVTVAQIR